MRLGTEVLDVNSEGYAAFQKFLNGLEYFPERAGEGNAGDLL